MARRSSVLLPDPFGPSRTVGVAVARSRLTSSRIVAPPTHNEAFSSLTGRSLTGARMGSTCANFAKAPGAPGQRIDGDDQRDEHQPEPHRKRQVALRGL